MSYVRIHDGALAHPKLVGLIDWRNPFCVWVWGLAYCQQHLTDGAIPAAALPNPVAVKTAGRLVGAGLWYAAGEVYRVHDYLEWNDAKALVVARQGKARARQAAYEQKRRTRDVRPFRRS